ncbi:hypothetical protein MT325_m750R [Paramecium bursaria chlorella virus MT325]|uniref:Uncharacterized protein m750R n=1 Tax=Paramecium bursaria Chlorella virus MT325 TaxID=346932 RepID=A7IVD0_PBCVM|nr:hypothetical protein MT325_m750R [Paramecium bursaria chlorella virus MT325]
MIAFITMTFFIYVIFNVYRYSHSLFLSLSATIFSRQTGSFMARVGHKWLSRSLCFAQKVFLSSQGHENPRTPTRLPHTEQSNVI